MWAAIACELCRAGMLLLGIMVATIFLAYLRPSGALGLTSRSLSPPIFPSKEGQRSKTGKADDIFLSERRHAQWMDRAYRVLTEKGSGEPLSGCTFLDFASALVTACQGRNLRVAGCQMRLSGASMNRADGPRSLDAAQERGRGHAQRSVRRYEKHGRLSEGWRSLSANRPSYSEKCDKLLEGIIVKGVAPRSLPLQW